MKRFTTRILVCLVPTILSIVVVAWAVNQYVHGRGGFRFGVDLVGGTTLVYEVDETKLPENFKAEDLAAALKRRIDPADLYNITIRPVPGTPPRVEIVLPTGGRRQAEAEQTNWDALLAEAAKKFGGEYKGIRRGKRLELVDEVVKQDPKADRAKVAEWVEAQAGGGGGGAEGRKTLTGEEIENIKGLIERQGRLEFKILANSRDDKGAIDAAKKWFDDPKSQGELKRLETRAEPPPPPKRADGGTEFPVTHPNGVSDTYAYRWVEIGKSELYSLGLNTEALAKSEPVRKAIEDYRNTGKAFTPSVEGGFNASAQLSSSNGVGGCLFYVRKVSDWSRRLSKDREQGKDSEFFLLVREPSAATEIRGDDLVRAAPDSRGEGGRPAISFQFNPEGGERFYELTSRNKSDSGEGGFKRFLAVIFDGQIDNAPSLISAIRTNGQITGEFTPQELTDRVRILRAGALPATLKKDPVSQNSMSATLGEDTIQKGTWSIVWAFVAVMVFMVFYYRFAGLVACVALLANLLLTVAGMVLVQAAFTLPGLAGLVLMLGMAVDANVLIYERLREERDAGATLAQALRNGYDRAFPTILDTHLSSIFTAIVLYVVGNDQLKGFGISLTMGLLISLFTSLYMTRTIFEIWFSNGWLKQLSFFEGLVKLVHARYWDFMSIRHYWFTGTAILTVLGAALFIYRAESDPQGGKSTVLNIDFTGGTAFTGRLAQPMSLSELREMLDKNPLADQSINQEFVQSGAKAESVGGEAKSDLFTLRTSVRDTKTVLSHILDVMKDKLKQLRMKVPERIDEKATQVTLSFTDQEGKTDFASAAQIATLLNDQFNSHGLARATFSLDRPTEPEKEKEDHFSELILRLNEPVSGKTLGSILKEAQDRLAASPIPERLENFDKQLAANTQERALYAILASWAAILLFLWFRFGNWTFGAAAVVCLIHDLFFTLGCIAAAHYVHGTFVGNLLGISDFKIDLAAIAALLTLVGYSVNDTIVVFDRIREVRGKSPVLTSKMINDAVNQTLTRTLLASATVMVVVLVLYIFGGEGVKLFAFVMIVGVFVGTYSSIYIASPLLLIFGEGNVPGAPSERPLPAVPSTAIKK